MDKRRKASLKSQKAIEASPLNCESNELEIK